MCTFTFYHSICNHHHRTGHSKRTWCIDRCSTANLNEQNCPNIPFESHNLHPILNCLECAHEETENSMAPANLPPFVHYKPNPDKNEEHFDMDAVFQKPGDADEEIAFMRNYFGLQRGEQVLMREKMARRVREFRLGDVWVVCMVGWGLVWCEWRRCEGRSEMGNW
ncbi:hypothetical protein E2P81_ATG11258 [Venturia nashicola]|nr:hypothetical protein E2P81_ATG11258 [Venturia nashicola]